MSVIKKASPEFEDHELKAVGKVTKRVEFKKGDTFKTGEDILIFIKECSVEIKQCEKERKEESKSKSFNGGDMLSEKVEVIFSDDIGCFVLTKCDLERAVHDAYARMTYGKEEKTFEVSCLHLSLQ